MLPQRQVDKFSKVFLWLGTITSECRDLDVHLLNSDSYAMDLSQDQCVYLQPLKQLLQQRRRESHQALKKALSSPRYSRFMKSWRTFLDSDLSAGTVGKNAHRSIATLSRKTIWRVYRRVLEQGDRIGLASPAEQYHELRKTCKKLRYLLDFFSSLIPQEDSRSLIRSLKTIQNELGSFHDLQVHSQTIATIAELALEDEVAGGDERIERKPRASEENGVC
ncbi:MAG: CHAD domain-containing protein [Lentisphaeria bacterium]